MSPEVDNLDDRFDACVRTWHVVIEATLDTQSSRIGFGTRGARAQPVVLKVVRSQGDEWHSGGVLHAFAGNGCAQVYEYADGALLLERLQPATPLVSLSLAGRDADATDILAVVMQRMQHPHSSLEGFTTVEEWSRAFERYRTSARSPLLDDLIDQAQQLYNELCASQTSRVLLHGDLHHYNVVLDERRGWTAIDPKGVVGELEYEIGAALRNPWERPDLFAAPQLVEHRVARYARAFGLDADRILAWGFAQAVLSAVWTVDDGFPLEPDNPALVLARAIKPVL